MPANVNISSVAYQAMQNAMKAQAAKIAELEKNQGTVAPAPVEDPITDYERTQLQEQIDAQNAEIDRLREIAMRVATAKAGTLSLKVSEKGGVSVYGLGRFPITLYRDQWIRLLDMTEEIRSFMAEHDSELKTKPVKE